MKKLLTLILRRKKTTAGIVLGILIIFILSSGGDDTLNWVTGTVEEGTVRQIISVSGDVNAVNTADLSFPVGGILESITVKEGDVVEKGQILATLKHNDLQANYQDALASVRIAEADRGVSKTTIEIARENLERVTREQKNRVDNAYRTLLSSDLEARPKEKSNDDAPPIISGTYTCAQGTYTMKVYASGSGSGYSYVLSGLEDGTYTAYTESAAALGKCGLSVQFIENESYNNSAWTIQIPNTDSNLYTENLNAYNLAVTQSANAIRAAEQNLTLVEQNNTLESRDSIIEAQVLQAQARLDAIGAQISDHILTAPFAGTVTNIEPVTGESIGTEPVITMVSDEAFALTALIPEIDITKIGVGQKADVVFDARDGETLKATLIFISPLATEIDGVSYFEAKFILDAEIDWLRSGLNADVDIIIDTHENVTRIPKRYLTEKDGTYTVLVPDGEKTASKTVTVTFEGNDGYVEIAGLDVGTTVIAP
jgi:multidrug efflux pump subunit AcrA (membrane-fusion protein)